MIPNKPTSESKVIERKITTNRVIVYYKDKSVVSLGIGKYRDLLNDEEKDEFDKERIAEEIL